MSGDTVYVIYKCAKGWCMEPGKLSGVREPLENTYAFSTLVELVEFLQVKEQVKEESDFE